MYVGPVLSSCIDTLERLSPGVLMQLPLDYTHALRNDNNVLPLPDLAQSSSRPAQQWPAD